MQRKTTHIARIICGKLKMARDWKENAEMKKLKQLSENSKKKKETFLNRDTIESTRSDLDWYFLIFSIFYFRLFYK